MSKKMTPCEKLGYKVGDKFRVVDGTGVLYAAGSFITLIRDDGTSCPRFNGVHARYESGDGFFPLDFVEKVVVNNETERMVGVEMKSEPETTIKVIDWHKSGELPPVGEVCLYVVSERLSAEVEITAHARFGLCFVEVGKSGERYVSKTAELHRFIPIRTEREKAIDEMVGEFINHYGDPKGGERYIGIAIKLYDAGYRKEVK